MRVPTFQPSATQPFCSARIPLASCSANSWSFAQPPKITPWICKDFRTRSACQQLKMLEFQHLPTPSFLHLFQVWTFADVSSWFTPKRGCQKRCEKSATKIVLRAHAACKLAAIEANMLSRPELYPHKHLIVQTNICTNKYLICEHIMLRHVRNMHVIRYIMLCYAMY